MSASLGTKEIDDRVDRVMEKYRHLLLKHPLQTSDGKQIDPLQVIIDVRTLVKMTHSYEWILHKMGMDQQIVQVRKDAFGS